MTFDELDCTTALYVGCTVTLYLTQPSLVAVCDSGYTLHPQTLYASLCFHVLRIGDNIYGIFLVELKCKGDLAASVTGHKQSFPDRPLLDEGR